MLEKLEDLCLTFFGIIYCDLFLSKSCFWPKAKMEKYQYHKLKKLLLVCQNEVPYYKRLFREIGFDTRRDFKTIKDLEKIPITTKTTFRKNSDDFLNKKYEKSALIMKTSGSTGEPLKVYVSKKHWIMEQAVVWMQWKWAGYHFRNKMAIIRSYAPKNERCKKLIKFDKVRNFIYYSPYDMTDKNMKKYLDHMAGKKVLFLRGYPSSLEVLAKYVLRTGYNVPKIKGIFVSSEVLSDTTRKCIERAFGAKVMNYYGLAECIVAAGDCSEHQGLHIFGEYGYMEFLDTQVEKQKKIIGTNLNNYAMPLLRYETNDLAEILEGTPFCNHTYQTIKNVAGRCNNVIKLKDRDIPLTNIFTIMDQFEDVVSWQIIQHGDYKVELILENKVTNCVELKLYEEFRSRLPKEILFHISNGGIFKRSGEGKKWRL